MILSMVDTESSQLHAVELFPISILPKNMPIRRVALLAPAVAMTLDVSEATLRGWISRKQFPPKDGEFNGKAPYWLLTTIMEYLRNAPGGRLPYQVG